MTDSLHAFLRSRRSIRHFSSDPVPAIVIQRIIETATYAPSAHNDQPWRFALLTSTTAKIKLAEAMVADFRRDLEKDNLLENDIVARLNRSRNRITEAPIVIILSMDASSMAIYPDAKRQQAEMTMTIQTTSLAGLQLLLAAHAEGLGGCWTCAPLFAPETIREALEFPSTWQPQAMFFIGYPAEKPQAKELKPLEELLMIIDE